MGSLANVKKSKKSPVHKVKKLLLEAENCSDRMGNLCSMGASAAAKKVKKLSKPANSYDAMSLQPNIRQDQ